MSFNEDFDLLKNTEQPIKIRCQGKSMLPGIQPGALLLIQPGTFSGQSPQKGEIIAFRRGEGLVCHRFYGVQQIGHQVYGIEKGDFNRITGIFRIEDYYGKLAAVDGKPAVDFFREVQKPRIAILLWGLLKEWIYRFYRKSAK
jgi:hypothetical protein